MNKKNDPILAEGRKKSLTQERPGFHALRVDRCGSLQEGLGIFVALRHDGQHSTHHQAAG